MTVTPLQDKGQEMPPAQGHAIGFVDTPEDCDAVVRSLNALGFPDSAMLMLAGEDGIQLLKRMMRDSLWGEADQTVLQRGLKELELGHYVLIIQVNDREEGLVAAKAAAQHGGHSFTHFGALVDDQLTP